MEEWELELAQEQFDFPKWSDGLKARKFNH